MFENKNGNYIKFNMSKNYVVGESANAVLFRVPASDTEFGYFWVNKKAIYYSNYSNILNLSLIDDEKYKFGIYKENNKDWKKPDSQLTASQLINELINIKDIKLLNTK